MSEDNTTPPARKPNSGQFQKGQSGNPGGRPKIPDEIKQAFESYLPDAIKVLGRALKGKDERLAVMAAVHIAERVLGKPQQNVNAKVETTDLARAHLDALRALGAARGTADNGEDDAAEVTH
jgi:hypothetical protein